MKKETIKKQIIEILTKAQKYYVSDVAWMKIKSISAHLSARNYDVNPSSLRRYMKQLNEAGKVIRVDLPAGKVAYRLPAKPQPTRGQKKLEIIKSLRADFTIDAVLADRYAQDIVEGHLTLAQVKNDLTRMKKLVKFSDKPEPEPKADPKPTAPKKARYTRAHSLADALKSGAVMTALEVAAEANARYTVNGGKDNLKESRWITGHSLTLLEAMGVIEFTDDNKVKVLK